MDLDFPGLAEQYKNELLNNIIPFWEANSIDRELGGYFTCLNREMERMFPYSKRIVSGLEDPGKP